MEHHEKEALEEAGFKISTLRDFLGADDEEMEEINKMVERAFPKKILMSRFWGRLKRSVRYFYQRRVRGFDDSVTWSLDHEIAEWIYPRLKRYLELADQHIIIDDEMKSHIETILKGFENYDENYPFKTNDTSRAWESLGKVGYRLWW